MFSIFKSLYIKEKKLDNRAERFLFRHPHAAVFIMFMGLPLFILAAVLLLTALVTLPVALIIG